MSNKPQPTIDPRKKLVTISEAASESGRTVQALLEAAADKKIELLFECPPGQVISLLASDPAGIQAPYVGYADDMRIPEYFVVRPEICRALLHRPYMDIFDAEVGYKTSGYTRNYEFSHLQKLPAGDADKSEYLKVTIDAGDARLNALPEGMSWVRWAFRSGNATMSHRIRCDDLFLATLDLYRWMQGEEGIFVNGERIWLKDSNQSWSDEVWEAIEAYIKEINPVTKKKNKQERAAELIGVTTGRISQVRKERKEKAEAEEKERAQKSTSLAGLTIGLAPPSLKKKR